MMVQIGIGARAGSPYNIGALVSRIIAFPYFTCGLSMRYHFFLGIGA